MTDPDAIELAMQEVQRRAIASSPRVPIPLLSSQPPTSPGRYVSRCRNYHIPLA